MPEFGAVEDVEGLELLKENVRVLDDFLVLGFGLGVAMVLGNWKRQGQRRRRRWVVGHDFYCGGGIIQKIKIKILWRWYVMLACCVNTSSKDSV